LFSCTHSYVTDESYIALTYSCQKKVF